jgi:hypothetical protein
MGKPQKRQKRAKNKNRDTGQPLDPLAPDALGDVVNPFKQIFPWDFPGQNADRIEKGGKSK